MATVKKNAKNTCVTKKVPPVKTSSPIKKVEKMEEKARKTPSKSQKLLDVVFNIYSPDSKSVDIAGEFNGWEPTKGRMKKDKTGNWSLKTKLAPGDYQYKVVFDGAYWELDQKAPSIQAEHGPNSLVHVS